MKNNIIELFECTTEDPILDFSGSYSFLSNFWDCPIVYDSVQYKSSEHAYMCQKTFDEELRLKIRNAPTANKAKTLARGVPLRSDWEEVKLTIMYEVLYAKFTQNEDLKLKLLATGNRYLEEGNWWGDVIWGVCKGVGTNYLGQLLMTVRKQLRGEL
jgi:ribA/ribD-fused uncharacterized protein